MIKTTLNKSLLTALLAVFGTAGLVADAGARTMTEYPRIKLRSLEKTTARTRTFEANVGSTLKFGSLYIKVQSCQKSAPIDQPESAAFLQIWEVVPNEDSEETESQWVFSGWMFASSPALSPMDHAIYDVWLLDCLADENAAATIDGKEVEEQDASDIEGDDPAEEKTFDSILKGLTAPAPDEGEMVDPETASDAAPSEEDGQTAVDGSDDEEKTTEE